MQRGRLPDAAAQPVAYHSLIHGVARLTLTRAGAQDRFVERVPNALKQRDETPAMNTDERV
jgi:hypothetical protein